MSNRNVFTVQIILNEGDVPRIEIARSLRRLAYEIEGGQNGKNTHTPNKEMKMWELTIKLTDEEKDVVCEALSMFQSRLRATGGRKAEADICEKVIDSIDETDEVAQHTGGSK